MSSRPFACLNLNMKNDPRPNRMIPSIFLPLSFVANVSDHQHPEPKANGCSVCRRCWEIVSLFSSGLSRGRCRPPALVSLAHFLASPCREPSLPTNRYRYRDRDRDRSFCQRSSVLFRNRLARCSIPIAIAIPISMFIPTSSSRRGAAVA